MEKQPQNGLPRETQLRTLALGAVVLAGLLILVPLLRDSLSTRPAPPLPVMVPGGLRPEAGEWEKIRRDSWRAEQLTARNADAKGPHQHALAPHADR